MTTTIATDTVRAGAYCRISSDPDDKREGTDRQRKDTATLCEVKGWELVDYYVDDDRSASNGKERPEWRRLLADIKAGRIDAIAAWDQDRSWRLMADLEELRRFFAELGRPVKLATTGQGEIDLFSPTGVLQAQIKTAVSEHEVAMMRVRMRRANRERADNGATAFHRAFGYRRAGHTDKCGPKCKAYHHELDPVTAPLVKDAYKMLLAGASLGAIAAMFNDAKAFGLNGKPWTETTVSLFLRAARNAGMRSYQRDNAHLVKGNWPELVALGTWQRAQDKLNDAARRPGQKSVREHTLTGALTCGRCGHHLGGQRLRKPTDGEPHPPIAYSCRNCRKLAIRANHIEPFIAQLVARRLAQPDAVDLLKAEMDPAEAEAIRSELNGLYARLEAIGVERGLGELTGPQAKAATETVNGLITRLERRQVSDDRWRVLEGLELGTERVAAQLDRLAQEYPGRYRAVVRLLLSVTVHPVGRGATGHYFDPDRVEVEWR